MMKNIKVGDLVDIKELRTGYVAEYRAAEVLKITEKSLIIKDRFGRQVVSKDKIQEIEKCTYYVKR